MSTTGRVATGLVNLNPVTRNEEQGLMTIDESDESVVTLKETMQIAYEILQHLRSLKLASLSDKPMKRAEQDLFEEGPGSPNASQEARSRRGLFLEMRNGSPTICTPIGQWDSGLVTPGNEKEVGEMLDVLEDLLGLEAWKLPKAGKRAPFYIINQWNGKKLPEADWPTGRELLSSEKARAIWQELSKEILKKP